MFWEHLEIKCSQVNGNVSKMFLEYNLLARFIFVYLFIYLVSSSVIHSE